MKTAIAITAAGLMSFGVANIANAASFHLSPESTKFTGTGSTSATVNGVTLSCDASFKGKTTATGVGKITSGSFSGAVGCSSVTLQNLPWKAKAINSTEVKIANVTFQSPIGNCGPGSLTTTLQNGVVSFSNQALPGGCTVSGSITTSPTLSIVSGANELFSDACSKIQCAPEFRKSDQ